MTARPGEPHIGLVVEGPGDKGALPVILRQHLHEIGDYREILGPPISVNGRENCIRTGGLEGYVAAAAARPGCVAVLVVLDGEGDCVCELGPELLARTAAVTGKPVRVALAERDFEDWLYSSAESLDLEGLLFEEGERGARKLRAALKPKKYAKPVWQPRLAGRLDLALARSRSRSFDRLLVRFEELRDLVS